MEKGQLLYEGKAKRLYATEQEDILFVEYKDSATAFNGEKKAEIDGKGTYNNRITSLLFERLNEKGIPSHFVEQLSDREQLVKRVEIIPIEVVTRNVAAGSLTKRLGLEEGTELQRTIVEFYYKDDALGDPLITEEHIDILNLASKEEVNELYSKALQVNEVLSQFFNEIGVILVDFKLEFGRLSDGSIVLADEISPDTCRFWDAETNEKLDKDRFRRDMGGVEDAYNEMMKRVFG